MPAVFVAVVPLEGVGCLPPPSTSLSAASARSIADFYRIEPLNLQAGPAPGQ
jgi:hypothetical protein